MATDLSSPLHLGCTACCLQAGMSGSRFESVDLIKSKDRVQVLALCTNGHTEFQSSCTCIHTHVHVRTVRVHV